jgi:hypothetical protein
LDDVGANGGAVRRPVIRRPSTQHARHQNHTNSTASFIHKDRAKVRATHDAHWHGFLEGSREMIRGIDQYMNYVGP